MILLSILDKIFKGDGNMAPTTNLSGALEQYRNRAANEQTDDGQAGLEGRVIQLLAPYTKNIAAECAQTYIDYVAATGNTTCESENVAYKMRNSLWQAWERARIAQKCPDANRLPELTSYFVEVVRVINSCESYDNRVAYIRVHNGKTKDSWWFIAPVREDKRAPRIATGEDEEVAEMLT